MSVPIRVSSIALRIRRIMDTDWTGETRRVPVGLSIDGGSAGRLMVDVLPGRHTLEVRFERVAASAYHVHVAELRVLVAASHRGALEVSVSMTRRHPRPR